MYFGIVNFALFQYIDDLAPLIAASVLSSLNLLKSKKFQSFLPFIAPITEMYTINKPAKESAIRQNKKNGKYEGF